MGFLAIANAYTMRTTLSVAITKMVVKPNTNQSHDFICEPDDGFDEGGVSYLELEYMLSLDLKRTKKKRFAQNSQMMAVNMNGTKRCKALYCHHFIGVTQ